MMIAIGKPYVSLFLVETLRQKCYPVISTAEAMELIGDQRLNWITEVEATTILRKNPDTKIYTNSENTLGWLEKIAGSSVLTAQVHGFKNKIRFRELLADSYPDLLFRRVGFNELRTLHVEALKFPLIIKPAVGFFSVAVHRVENSEEWEPVMDAIESEVKIWSGTYPTGVIDTTDFILETFIEGEEYAVDCYYDEAGHPVILNILHHPFSSGTDTSDRVYTTSEDIINQVKEGIRDFLERLGKKANLINFPMHVEVRIDLTGQLIPIEVNPLRFGGWCTTGDLSWFAYGINSYACFFDAMHPDWEEIFRTRKGKKYSVIVLDNNSGIDESLIESFDYERIVKDFERVMEVRKVDFRTFGVFGFLFVETSEGNEAELAKILTSDLKAYIHLKGDQ